MDTANVIEQDEETRTPMHMYRLCARVDGVKGGYERIVAAEVITAMIHAGADTIDFDILRDARRETGASEGAIRIGGTIESPASRSVVQAWFEGYAPVPAHARAQSYSVYKI